MKSEYGLTLSGPLEEAAATALGPAVTGAGAGLDRRQLLRLAGLGLAAPLLPAVLPSLLSPAAAWAQSLEASDWSPLSLGYVEGSEAVADLRRPPVGLATPGRKSGARPDDIPIEGMRIVPAAEIFESDQKLVVRGMRLRVAGLYPPASLNVGRRADLPSRIDLDVLYPHAGAARAVAGVPKNRHLTWSFRKEPWNLSPPVTLRLPGSRHPMNQAEIEILVSWPGQSPARYRTSFASASENGRPRLRRGLYLVGLVPAAWESGAPLAVLAPKRVTADRFSILLSVDWINPPSVSLAS
jgi:hypothetical protein